MTTRPGRWPVVILSLLLASCASTPSPSVDLAACPTAAPTAGEAATILADASRATVKTNLGSFTIELDASSARIATANFVALARCGFYAGISFHRVLAGFVIQAGDPQTRRTRAVRRIGAGGPGYTFEVEFPTETQPYDKYMVAMANAMQYDQVTGRSPAGPTRTAASSSSTSTAWWAGCGPTTASSARSSRGRRWSTPSARCRSTTPMQGVPAEPVIIESVTIECGRLNGGITSKPLRNVNDS